MNFDYVMQPDYTDIIKKIENQLMTKCTSCDKPLTVNEVRECNDECFECNINYHIGRIAHHMREARITFEEAIRKVIAEVDK